VHFCVYVCVKAFDCGRAFAIAAKGGHSYLRPLAQNTVRWRSPSSAAAHCGVPHFCSYWPRAIPAGSNKS